MRKVGAIIMLSILLLFPLLIPAQKITFKSFTTADGLSNSRVRSFFHDSKGFIWIGTSSGLNRFDGNGFTIYKHQPENPGSILSNIVLAIREDSRGNFWVGTRDGLQLMNRDANFFFPLPGAIGNPLSDIGHVLVLHEDRNGCIWVGTSRGLYQISIPFQRIGTAERLSAIAGNGSFQLTAFLHQEQHANSLSNNRIWSIAEDREGYLWIGTGKGLNRLDLKNNAIERLPFKQNEYAPALATASVQALRADRAGRLWIGTENGLYRLSPDRKRARLFRSNGRKNNELSNDFITEIVEDQQGNIWIGSDGGGLDRWIAETESFVHHQYNYHEWGSLGENNVEALYEDRDGGLWIGTHKGVSYTSPHRKPFQYYRNTGVENSLSPGMVTSFFERRDGKLWIGIDDGGLDLFDPATDEFVHYRHIPGNSQSIGDDDVTAILEDRLGSVWIGTWGGGLSRLSLAENTRSGGTFLHYRPEDKRGSINDRNIWKLFEDSRGAVWVGTVNGGLNRYERDTDTFKTYQHDPQKPESLPQNWVLDIAEDNQGQLWIATMGSISRFVPESESFISYPVKSRTKPDVIQNLHCDRLGMIWLATDNGLKRFDPKNGLFKDWQEKDGLADNALQSILEDDQGYLWMTSEKGISKFDPQQERFVNYDANDGLQPGEFSVAHLKLQSGQFVFGGINGFNLFHPDSIKENNQIPPVVITGFKVMDQDVLLTSPVQTSSDASYAPEQQNPKTADVVLEYWQNDLSFEFAALSYLSPEKNRYKYKLEGDRSDWTETDASRRFASYTNLSPGSYTFRVIGSNNDGLWNEQGATLRIIIGLPWWKTTLAYFFYALLFSAIAYGAFHFLKKRWILQNQLLLEKAEANRLKELDSFKSRLYTSLTHELRTPLTVILGMAEQIRNEPQKYLQQGTQLIERNGQNLLALINRLLDLSKLENNALQLRMEQGDIVPFLRYVIESFQTYANSKNLSLRFFTTFESLVMNYDPEQLKQVMTNLLSNAMKFTPSGGEISLRLTITEDHLQISVKDSGIGIPEQDLPYIFDRFYQSRYQGDISGVEGTGIGLAHSLELVRLMEGNISVRSTVGKGSVFVVSLPIRQEPLPVITNGISRPEDAPGASPKDAAAGPVHDENKKAGLPQLLIIEDNPDVVAYLKACLQELYELDTAHNGRVGIEKALENIPDLIISDVMMPEKDGYQVCDSLKNDDRTSHIPIILLTAKADPESKITGLRRGADAYLAKPFHKEELLVHLEMLIEKQKRLVAHFSQGANKLPSIENVENDEVIRTEDAFLQKVRKIIEENYADDDFALPQLCRKLGMSRSQLFRKMKALTGTSPSQFLRTYRMQKAKFLIRTSTLSISEVAWKVGFKDAAHFSRTYQEAFGYTPSETRK